MPKSQEYIIRQKIATPLEFHDEFFRIFSEFSNPEPDPRDFGIYGIPSTFSYLDPRDFGIFHSEFFLDFQIPREFRDFWYFSI